MRPLQTELRQLLQQERPKVVSRAASNGDRSENADYLFGKKRLREIDRRVRHFAKRLESAVAGRSEARSAGRRPSHTR